jgi:hypothetical protein
VRLGDTRNGDEQDAGEVSHRATRLRYATAT